MELDAAEPVLGFEARIEPGLADVVDCCLQEAEIHAADEIRVLLCESVERAVPQDDSAVGAGLGFEAVFCEHIKQSTTPRPDAPPGGAPKPNANLPGKSKARRMRDILAPEFTDLFNAKAHTLMNAVGAIEIIAGLVVALRPRFGGYLVAAWLAGIIADLLLAAAHYDIALRDFGLLLAALSLARLATAFPIARHAGAKAEYHDDSTRPTSRQDLRR